MGTYISTIRFSEQGIQGVGKTTARAAEVIASAGSLGITVKETYWLLGESDGLLIFEAPDDQTASAFLLQIGAGGNVHTQTARAFTAAEMDAVLQKANLT